MITIDEALQYLGIDYADDAVKANVQRSLETAKKTLLGAVGDDLETYLPEDPRSDELRLIYLDDLYSDRGVVSAKVSGATRRMVHDLEWQLKLELRRKREEAGA